MRIYRQGDILLKELPGKPRGKKVVRTNGVLAEGEVTGHLHQVEDTTKAEVYEIEGKLFLSTKSGIRIIHDEHDPLVLPARKTFEVVRQREHTGVGRERSRYVSD